MNEKLLELTKIIELRKGLEENIAKAKNEFTESIKASVDALNDINEQELILREEALLLLESQNKETETVGNYTINRAVKKTNQIVNPALFKADLNTLGNVPFYNQLGIDPMVVAEQAFEETTIVKDKKTLEEIIKKVENFNGNLPAGVQVKETKYITVSENKAT